MQKFCKGQNGEKRLCRSSANAKMGESVLAEVLQNAKMEKRALAEVLQGHHEKRRKALTGWTSAKTFLDS